MKTKINVDALIIYIEVFLIIFLSGSWRQGNFNDELDYIKWMMLGIGAYCMIRSFKEKKELKVLLLLISSCTVYLLFESKIFLPSVGVFAFFLTKFVLFIFFALFARKKGIDILEVVANIVFVIAIYSLLMYILANIFQFNLPHRIYTINGIDYSSYFLFITTNHPNFQLNLSGYHFNRLMSFFWEPGVYQIYLCYALFYFVFFRTEKRKLAFIILILNIIFAGSTTGICVTIFILGYSIIQKTGWNKKTFLLLISSIVMTAICIAYFWGIKMQTSSYSTRMNDFLVGWRIFKEHWLTGTGFQNYTEYIITRGNNQGSSNGLMSWFGSMGLIGGVFLIYPFIMRVRNIVDSKEKKIYIIYFIVFIVQNASEPITNHPFMSLIAAIEYSYLLF